MGCDKGTVRGGYIWGDSLRGKCQSGTLYQGAGNFHGENVWLEILWAEYLGVCRQVILGGYEWTYDAAFVLNLYLYM